MKKRNLFAFQFDIYFLKEGSNWRSIINFVIVAEHLQSGRYMKFIFSNNIKKFLYLGVIINLLSIIEPILKFCHTSIRTIVYRSIKFPSELEASTINDWASKAASNQSPLSYTFVGIILVALLILFVVFYKKNRLKPIFMGVLFLHLAYFALFTLVIYPQLETIQATPEKIGDGSNSIYEIWMLTLSYIGGSSIFASFSLSWDSFILLFWVLANQTVTRKEASWLYPSLIFPHLIGKGIGYGIMGLFGFKDVFLNHTGYTSNLMIILILHIIIIPAIYLMLNRLESIEDNSLESLQDTVSFPFKFHVKYLMTIATILLCYGVCTTYLKITSNGLFFSMTPHGGFEQQHMWSHLFYQLGVEVIFILSTFWLIWRIGWFYSSLIVPLMLVFPAVFYIGIISFDVLTPDLAFWSNVLVTGSIAGTYWTLFISTKEMAYIPLPLKTKARGKALIEFLTPYLIIQKMVLSDPLPQGMGGWGLKWGTYGQLATVFFIWFLWIFILFKLRKYYYQAEASVCASTPATSSEG